MQTLCVIASLFFASVVSLVAAEATASESSASGVSSIALIITGATPLLIALVKIVVPKVPKVALPFAAPLVGAALQICLTFAGMPLGNPYLGLFLGAAGVGLREAVDQFKKMGTDGTSLALGLFLVFLLTGCASYNHERQTATGPEVTSFRTFLMLGKASQIKAVTQDGTYKRSVGVGSIEGQGDTEMLKAAFQAGLETGKTIATGVK